MKTGKVVMFSYEKTYKSEELEEAINLGMRNIATAAELQRYKGGKNQDGVFQRIINQIPPHQVWIECCAGSAAITRRIREAPDRFCIEMDKDQAQRLERLLPGDVFVKCGNFMELLTFEELDEKEVFLFIDPPYLVETRSFDKPIYKHEWTEEDHIAFLVWLQEVKCRVLVTHPTCSLYSEALKDWRTIEYEYMTHKGKRSDCIWMNYPYPEELHDYSYLGDSRTQRQQISRLSDRWCKRFDKLTRLEQGKILTALQEQFKIEY